MITLVLLALTAPTIQTTTTVSARPLHLNQFFYVGSPLEIDAQVQAATVVWGRRPSGKVRFDIADQNLNQTTLYGYLNPVGKAQVNFTPTEATTYTVIATYLGDKTFETSSSIDTQGLYTFDVNPGVTFTFLTPSRTSVTVNGSVNFTAHVSTGGAFGRNAPVANMSVTFTFSDGSISPITTTTNSRGDAFSGPVVFQNLGTWTVTAAASDPNSNYQPSTSNTSTANVVAKPFFPHH